MHTTWGLIRDLKCTLRFLVDSNGTTIASYRGRLLAFPEVRPNQITTSHTDNPVGEVVLSTEKSSSQNSCRSCGSCSADTPFKIKAERQHYR